MVQLQMQVNGWNRKYEDTERGTQRLGENMEDLIEDHIEEYQRLTHENDYLRQKLEPEERLRHRGYPELSRGGAREEKSRDEA
jgi:hypothetical protein